MSTSRKRNLTASEDTINVVNADWRQMFAEQRQTLLNLHLRELSLLEREERYCIANFNHVLATDTDHISRMHHCANVMESIKSLKKELSMKGAFVRERRERNCLITAEM